jgi:hypothetical protein
MRRRRRRRGCSSSSCCCAAAAAAAAARLQQQLLLLLQLRCGPCCCGRGGAAAAVAAAVLLAAPTRASRSHAANSRRAPCDMRATRLLAATARANASPLDTPSEVAVRSFATRRCLGGLRDRASRGRQASHGHGVGRGYPGLHGARAMGRRVPLRTARPSYGASSAPAYRKASDVYAFGLIAAEIVSCA